MTQKTISSSNTKQQIIDAYNELFEKYKDLEKNKLSSQISLPTNSPKNIPSKNDLFSFMESLKVKFIDEQESLFSKLKDKYNLLELLEDEIKDKQDYLEKVLKISAEAESLFALVDLQTKKKQEFEEEMEKKLKDQKLKEEEWNYIFEQKKKNEKYEWESKKQDTERKFNQELDKKIFDLNKKEIELNEKKKEYDNLLKEKEILEKENLEMPQKIEKEISSSLLKDFEREKVLIQKDYDIKDKVRDLEIENLKSKLEDLQKQNIQLQKSLNDANSKMESLASKVVE